MTLLNRFDPEGDRASVFKQLEEELIEQVNVATANYKQFRDMGDVNNSKK